jgi:hypothetical protein
MSDRIFTFKERSTELTLADRPGSGAPHYMQKEFKFAVEYWLFEDSSFIVWSNGDLSLSGRSLALTIPDEDDLQ